MEAAGESIDDNMTPWYCGRTVARFLAVQGAYSMSFSELTAFDVDDMVGYLCEMRSVMELKRVDRKMLSRLLLFLVENVESVDVLIKANISDKWSLERVNLISLAIIRAGVSELLCLNTNECIVINEYAGIAAAVLEDGEVNFVNAILNKAKTVRGIHEVVKNFDAGEVSSMGGGAADAGSSLSDNPESAACISLTDSLTMGC